MTSNPPLISEQTRRAVTRRVRTFTVAMLVVSAAVAVAGMRFATAYSDRESATAQLGSGGPSIVPDGATSDSSVPTSREPSSSASDATTTTARGGDTAGEAQRGGASASSSVPRAEDREAGGEPLGRSPEERGRWALTQLSYPWDQKLPGWTVAFHDGRDGLFGLTLVDDKHIEIYVRDDQTDDLLVHIVAHEIGHAVDVSLNSGKDRREWQAARGLEDEPWWPSSAASDFRTGAGDFAESFAYWQARSDNFRSKLGPVPDADQLELMAKLAGG